MSDLLNEDINYHEKVIATCGSGVSACVIALAFYCLGNDNVSAIPPRINPLKLLGL